jgi:hypothetical protein
MIHLVEDLGTWEAEVLPIPEPQAERPCTNNRMLLHCGGQVIERNALFCIQTPRATDTWFPLPHRHLVEEVENQLTDAGFSLLGQTHAVSHNGHRYFGLLEVSQFGHSPENGHGWVVGLRNSHDKTFPAGLVAGTRVFICDNLAFSGLIQIRRKHTRFAVRDLRQLTARAVGQLGSHLVQLDKRIEAYRDMRLTDTRAHDLVIKATDCRAITTSQIPEVLSHWRKPEHEEFNPRTGWSLFNAFTEAFKGINPHTAINRCEALHGLFDGAVALAK